MAYNPGMVVGNAVQVGVREELADYVAVADSKSCPFTSMAPKGKDIGNMQFSWQVDGYTDPVPGGTPDGKDVTLSAGATSNASSARTRLYNLAQVFRRVHRTGFVAETSNVAGVSSETAKGVAKRLVELKRDIESTFTCTNQAYTAEADTPTGSLTSSLGKWLTTNVSTGLGAPPDTYETPTASVSTITSANFAESTVQDVLTSIYTETGVYRDYDAFVGTTVKRNFTLLTNSKSATNATTNTYTQSSVRTFNQEIGDKTYASAIDVFEGDFGTIRLHPTTFIAGTNSTAFIPLAYKGYICPMEMVELRYAKLPEVKDLPDAGGGPIKLVQAIAGLVVKNPLGFGMFNGAS